MREQSQIDGREAALRRPLRGCATRPERKLALRLFFAREDEKEIPQSHGTTVGRSLVQTVRDERTGALQENAIVIRERV